MDSGRTDLTDPQAVRYAYVMNGNAAPPKPDTTERVWANQMHQTQIALEQHTITVDGDTFIDPTNADPAIVALHQKLTTVGYANGWITGAA